MPLWLKGGLIGVGIYFGVILLTFLFWIIGAPLADKYTFPSGSLGFLLPIIIPLMTISFYPGIVIAGSYQAIGIIILINLAVYFLVGAGIGRIIGNRKRLR